MNLVFLSGEGDEFGSPMEGDSDGYAAVNASGSEPGSGRSVGGGSSRKRGLGLAPGQGLGPLHTEGNTPKHGGNNGSLRNRGE